MAETDLIRRQAAIEALGDKPLAWTEEYELGLQNQWQSDIDALKELPSAQPELIEKAAYIRGFEQGRTQGMIDAHAQPEKNDNFEKQIHSMFDHIWDCEIACPPFQDTVGDLMGAVIQCYNGLPSAQPEQIARDIATIIENDQDMRVILKNAERAETRSCDCISREAAIHLIAGYDGVMDKSVAKRLLIQMPSAQPERKKGKWIPETEDWRNQIVWVKCSECGFDASTSYNFCPNCGSYNGGENEN